MCGDVQTPAHICAHAHLFTQKDNMNKVRTTLTALFAAAFLIAASGCAVTRGQESVGEYVDDAAITTAVKARFIENRAVDAASMKVETLNGTVLLSGFAETGGLSEANTGANVILQKGPTEGLQLVRAVNQLLHHRASRKPASAAGSKLPAPKRLSH